MTTAAEHEYLSSVRTSSITDNESSGRTRAEKIGTSCGLVLSRARAAASRATASSPHRLRHALVSGSGTTSRCRNFSWSNGEFGRHQGAIGTSPRRRRMEERPRRHLDGVRLDQHAARQLHHERTGTLVSGVGSQWTPRRPLRSRRTTTSFGTAPDARRSGSAARRTRPSRLRLCHRRTVARSVGPALRRSGGDFHLRSALPPSTRATRRRRDAGRVNAEGRGRMWTTHGPDAGEAASVLGSRRGVQPPRRRQTSSVADRRAARRCRSDSGFVRLLTDPAPAFSRAPSVTYLDPVNDPPSGRGSYASPGSPATRCPRRSVAVSGPRTRGTITRRISRGTPTARSS